MDNNINDKTNQNVITNNNTNKSKKKGRRISEVVPIQRFNMKEKKEIENVLINNQESILYNNINILKSDLPNIFYDINQIDKRNNNKLFTGKSVEGKMNSHYSRNINLFNSSGINDSYYLDNDNYNTTMKLRRLTQNKKSKNLYNDNDQNSMNITQLVWKKNRNMGFTGYKNNNSRNVDSMNENENYCLTHNNVNYATSFTTKNNNETKKFTINKKNLLNTIKKPSKIKMEKKNLKYKIPIEFMNNLNNKKNNIQNNSKELNRRKINIKKRNINNNMRSLSNIVPRTKNEKIIKYLNEKENEEKESPSFIESTLFAFNGLVSKAQKLGKILIDNKEMINTNKDNELLNNSLKKSIEILNVEDKIDKIDKKIKDEHKTVEKLQKINSDLNSKINLFNENSQHYENKVKELTNVINQIKQNNNGSICNSKNMSRSESINIYFPSKQQINFMLEGKPKKKKLKFGFVESIFMKPDKFQIDSIKKNMRNHPIKKTKKQSKLITVNMNKNHNNTKNTEEKIDIKDYQDAAEQMANQIIIESLLSIEEEDNEK